MSVGAIDYPTLVMSSADEDAILDEVFEAMDAYYLDSYSKVVRFTKAHRPEWKPVVYRKYSRAIAEYAKGLHYEEREAHGDGRTPYMADSENRTTTYIYGVPSSDSSEPSL